MAQVIPLRPHTFRLDNCVIDDYAAEMGAIGVALYAVLQRYADRTTGQCWPSVSTMAATLSLSKKCVTKYLHHLTRLGLIDIAPRCRQRGGVPRTGGREPGSPPPQESRNVVPYPGVPDSHEQFPEEQFLTSLPTAKTTGQPCDNQAHEHRSPVLVLQRGFTPVG